MPPDRGQRGWHWPQETYGRIAWAIKDTVVERLSWKAPCTRTDFFMDVANIPREMPSSPCSPAATSRTASPHSPATFFGGSRGRWDRKSDRDARAQGRAVLDRCPELLWRVASGSLDLTDSESIGYHVRESWASTPRVHRRVHLLVDTGKTRSGGRDRSP